MTTPNTDLTEQIWEAIAEVRDQHPRVFNDAPTDDVVAAVLPIVDAAVKAGKAEALRDAADWLEPFDNTITTMRLRERADWIEKETPDGH